MDRLRFKTARQAKTEAAPIRYVAVLVAAYTDSELAIRWLIAPWSCAAIRFVDGGGGTEVTPALWVCAIRSAAAQRA